MNEASQTASRSFHQGVEPAHVLVNYFASLPSPQTDRELRDSLRQIVRYLAASQVFVGNEQDMDEELNIWASKGLIIRGQLDRRWRVPSHLRRFYGGFSRSVNEQLDRGTFGQLLTAIRAGHTKQSNADSPNQ